MPRPLRSLYPPGYYHVFARGVNKCPIFLTREDRLTFLRLLSSATRSYRWSCWAFCLMGNHFHLVLDVRQPFLSAGVQWLNGRYATIFNQAHDRVGHLFGGRFGCTPVETEALLVQECEYVYWNPVRAGLCSHPSEWPWTRMRVPAASAPSRTAAPLRGAPRSSPAPPPGPPMRWLPQRSG